MSKYFTQLDYFTPDYIESLRQELTKMLDNQDIGFHREHRQICLNTHKDFKDPSKINNGLYGSQFIEVRDQIKDFIIDFIKSELC